MQSHELQLDEPVSHLAVGWLLMIPLMYYAAMGGFWFQRGAGNNALAAGYSTLIEGPASAETTLTTLPIFALIFLLLFPITKSVFDALSKDKVFALTVLIAIASCAWSQFPDKSLKWSLALGVETVFSFYLYERFTSRQLFDLMLMLGWIGLGLSIVLALFFPHFGIDYKEDVGSWQGMYGNKNTCSMITSFMLPVAFYAPAATTSAKLNRVVYIALSVFLIFMTHSATGKILLAALAVYIAAMQTVRRLGSKDKGVALIVMTTVLAVIAVVSVSYSAEISYLLGKDPTLTGRTGIWRATMTSVMKRPALGYGYAAFWRGFEGESANVSLANGWSSVYAHSGFMDVLTELGAAGLILFIVSFGRALRDAVVCLRGRDSAFANWALCIVLLTVLLNVDEVSILVSYHLLWILYIIACIGLSERAARARSVLAHG